jgi:hypothetical protein
MGGFAVGLLARSWRSDAYFSALVPSPPDAVGGKNLPRFQADLRGPVPPRKNIPLSPSGKSGALLRASRPERGALRNVNNAGRDAMDADARFDETC